MPAWAAVIVPEAVTRQLNPVSSVGGAATAANAVTTAPARRRWRVMRRLPPGLARRESPRRNSGEGGIQPSCSAVPMSSRFAQCSMSLSSCTRSQCVWVEANVLPVGGNTRLTPSAS